MKTTLTLNQHIPDTLHNLRLDLALVQLFPDYSRSQIQNWIKEGLAQVDGVVITKSRFAVQTGQTVLINAQFTENKEWIAQDIPLNIVFEDDYLMVINKPIGLIVHPGAGNPDNTLVNALLHHMPSLAMLARAGIVHRLDKDTSGLLVIAKTLPVLTALVKQMQAREIHREYRALVVGYLISGGTVDAPMGRHPSQRVKMAVIKMGKPAVTHYRVLERFRYHTLLSVTLETGRTHQIRVHMTHLRFPIVGDVVYGKYKHIPQLPKEVQTAVREFSHQALHACKLSLVHPITQKKYEWKAPIPEDMKNLIDILRKDSEDDLNSDGEFEGNFEVEE